MNTHFSKNFVYDHELTLYPYAPLGILHNQGKWPEPIHQFSLVVFVHENDDTIAQWLVYHKKLGFDHVYIYYNGDKPSEFYRKLLPFIHKKKSFVTFHYCQFENSPQSLYFHFIRNHSCATKWHMILNNDDILQLHHTKTIAEFVNDFKAVDVIYFNLFLYGYQNDALEFHKTIPLINDSLYPQPSQLSSFTRMLIRSKIFPYQQAFDNLHTPIYYHINHLYPNAITRNVLHEDMSHYHRDNFNNQTIIQDKEKKTAILNNAYCLRFDHHFSQQTNQDVLKQFDQFYFSAFPKKKTNTHDHSRQTISMKRNYLDLLQRDTLEEMESRYVFPKKEYTLVSHGKPCKQSSAPQGMSPEPMAALLVSGKLLGKAQAITSKENDPWWCIDLQEKTVVHEIRLFHGLDYTSNIMLQFIIESSLDEQNWLVRYQKNDPLIIGGADGNLFRKKQSLTFGGINGDLFGKNYSSDYLARWIRIKVPGQQKIFALDQVQIFGQVYKQI